MIRFLRRLARVADSVRTCAEIEAQLHGVEGFAGRGEVEVEALADGSYAVEIEIEGVSFAASRAETFVDGASLCAFDVAGGRAEFERRYRPGEAPVGFGPGRTVDVRLDGARALTGVFRDER